MGSVFSKRAVSKATPPRKYPLRPAPPPHHSTPAPSTQPGAKPTTQAPTANQSSNPSNHSDPPQDPYYAASLRRLGAVTPPDPFTTAPPPNHQPIFPSSVQLNPAVQVLNYRRDIQHAADAEFARTAVGEAGGGRTFVDVVTLRRVLVLRDRGVKEGEIEREMGLKGGLVARLGRRGVVGAVGGGGLVEG